MTALMEERKKRKKIRLTISAILEQSCDGCPIAKSKSVNNRYIHCGTECPTGQRLKALGSQLITTATNENLWTDDEDLYLAKHYALYTTAELAIRLGKSMDEVWQRYKYLLAKAEMTPGNTHRYLRIEEGE